MRTVRFFRDLDAWQAAMELAVDAHVLADSLPARHRDPQVGHINS
jgi:hypothetical protein